MRPSNQYSRPPEDMGFSLEVKRSSGPQETSKVVKQKILPPRANQNPKSQAKHKILTPFDQPLDWHHELRKSSDDRIILQPKSSKNFQKPGFGMGANKNDELVKHMSNLPGYLQRVDKGEELQEKALNFGVLDWDSLERWKYKKHTPPSDNTNTSSSVSNSSSRAGGSLTLSCTIQSRSLAPHKRQASSHCPHLNPSRENSFSQDVKQTRGKVIPQDFETASRNTLRGQQKPHWTHKSSGRNQSVIKSGRGRRRDSDQRFTVEMETLLPILRKHESSHPSMDQTSAQNSVVDNRGKEVRESEFHHGQKHSPSEHKGIVLLLPKYSPGTSCSERSQTSESGTAFDRKPREANRESFSGGFSSEVCSAELYSEVPHSCPLPVGVETSFEPSVRPHSLANAQSVGLSNDVHSAELYSEISYSCPQQSGAETSFLSGTCLTNAQNVGLSNNASRTFKCSNVTPAISSQGKFINENASCMKPSRANVTTETEAVKGRHFSPNHRFSFSLGRISRSLSFKECSAIPHSNATCASANSGPVRSEVTDSFSSEVVHSAEFCPDCSHPVGVDTESDMRQQSSLTMAQSVDLSYDGSCMFTCLNETPNTSSSANAVRTFKQLDQEANELAAVRGRHPSPNCRFSFSLGRMSRSFSFRDGPTVPQLSSTYPVIKSGPVRCEGFDSLDNTNRNKASIHSRARSSPLRRLIDPLLKAMVTNPHHSAETRQLIEGNSNLTSAVISSPDSFQDRKHEASTIQALLQLTNMNGLPLFKLCVNKNGETLIARKKLTASGNVDPGWIYTFYSVREIKKKSGSWINQRHNGKSCGIGYEIVGQMKAFNSHFKELMIRECVLYSVDLRQTERDAPDLVPNRELAAIIVKTPLGNSRDDRDERNNCQEFIEKGFMESPQEDGNFYKKGKMKFSSTTVVLPGAVHGLPNKGFPSSLIERWRSGGSCDCGGWDIGCKLQILTNEDQSCKPLGPSISCTSPDHFVLFNQGGVHENKPIFRLAPFKKEIYSVEFSASSISLLQALAICVAAVGDQKSFDFSEVNNNLSETKLLRESTLTGTGSDSSIKMPAKCVPSPPPSPFGRV